MNKRIISLFASTMILAVSILPIAGCSAENAIQSDKLRTRETIEATITNFYDVLNTYDEEGFQQLLADDGGKWFGLLAIAESMEFELQVEQVGEPTFDGNLCTVEVTTIIVPHGVFAPDEPISTETMILKLESNLWKVSS